VEWVPALPEGPALDLLSRIFMDDSAPLTSDFLQDALDRLRAKRESRAAHELLQSNAEPDDQALRDFTERMRRLKGVPEEPEE
jgi:hypothetical protein